MSSISTNVLIDPSLPVAANYVADTFELMKGYTDENFNFFFPSSFLRYVISEEEIGSPTFRFFSYKATVPPIPTLKRVLEDNSQLYSSFEISSQMRERHSSFYSLLLDAAESKWEYYDEALLKILFEEWVFLQEKSVIVSRIRRTFDKFRDGGAATIEVGRSILQRTISRTVKKPGDDLSKIDKLRAFGKWMAVGAPPFVVLGISPVWGAVLSSATGVALLLDPSPDYVA